MKAAVLITGASTGFGRVAAATLANRGHTVFATMRDSAGRNAANAEALKSLANNRGYALHVVDLDVTDESSVDDAIRQILERAERIDVVINNAGVGALGITEAYTLEQSHELFEVNFFGMVRVNRAVLPAMRRQRSGLLIHVSSAAGRVVAPYMGMYCATKFAVEALADAYRYELRPFGIDSVLVEPGMHRTRVLDNFLIPSDQERISEYGSAAEYAQRVKAVFDAASENPNLPGPEPVAEAFARLIDMPFGDRPFRTVPTPSSQPLLHPYNVAADELRTTIAQRFGVSELVSGSLAQSA